MYELAQRQFIWCYRKGEFREDLYYRLSTTTFFLFLRCETERWYSFIILGKFAADFASKYKMPPLKPWRRSPSIG
jgi:transcriptional regulator with GAF, ATPase, and Fis domain